MEVVHGKFMDFHYIYGLSFHIYREVVYVVRFKL